MLSSREDRSSHLRTRQASSVHKCNLSSRGQEQEIAHCAGMRSEYDCFKTRWAQGAASSHVSGKCFFGT